MSRRTDKELRRQRRSPGRRVGTREERAGTILIVTEGKRTEPAYFNGLKRKLEAAHAGTVDVEAPVIQVRGCGESGSKLVDQARRIRQKSGKVYREVWVVCDADDFDLDRAQAEANASSDDVRLVWSNRSFELWLLLHFENVQASFTAAQLCDRLDRVFRGEGAGGYEKAREDVFEVLEEHGSVSEAMKRAERLRELYGADRLASSPSKCDPCTTVDKLVGSLLSYC